MAEKQVLALSHTHEAVMNFMLLNPSLALREVAEHTGGTAYSLAAHAPAFADDALRARCLDLLSAYEDPATAADWRALGDGAAAELVMDLEHPLEGRAGKLGAGRRHARFPNDFGAWDKQ
jgi:hypothetical protein